MTKYVLTIKQTCACSHVNAHVQTLHLRLSVSEVSCPAALIPLSTGKLMPSTSAANVTLVLTPHIQIEGQPVHVSAAQSTLRTQKRRLTCQSSATPAAVCHMPE